MKILATSREEKIIRILMVILFFLLPLAFHPFLNDPFALPKATVLRIVTVSLMGLCILKALRDGRISWKTTPLNLPVLVFLAICGLSTVFSVSPRLSFWGMHGFYFEGLLSFFCYAIIYFVTVNYLPEREKVLKAILSATIIVSLYALLEATGITFFVWRGSQPYPRVWSTFGNPNFLGAYLIMVIPIYFVFLIEARTLKKKIICSMFSLLSVLTLIFTYSRASWVGLVTGLVIFTILIDKKKLKTNAIFFAAIVVFAVALTCVYSRFRLLREEKTTVLKPVIDRALSITDFQEPGITARISGWKTAIRIALKRPVLGFGLDTLGITFRRFMSKEYEYLVGRFKTAGYAHNEFLQYLATMGLMGLGAYLLLLSRFFGILVSSAKSDKASFLRSLSPAETFPEDNPKDSLLAGGVVASSVSLLVNNQFSFSTLTPAALLWFFFGLGASLYPGRKKEMSLSLPRFGRHLVSVVVVLAVLLFSFYSFRFLLASRFDRLAEDSQREGNWRQAVLLQEKAVRFNPFEGLYRMHLARLYQQLITVTERKQEREKFYAKSLAEYLKEIKAYPGNALAYNGLGVTYIYGNDFLGKDTLLEAIRCFEKAIEFDPYFVEAFSNLASVIYQKGEVNRAIKIYQDIINLRPDVALPYYNLGNLYAQEGDYSQAISYWQKTLRIDPNFKEAEERLLQVWEMMEKGGFPRR